MGLSKEYVITCPSLERAKQLMDRFTRNYDVFISSCQAHSYRVELKGGITLNFVSEQADFRGLKGCFMSESVFIAGLREEEHYEDILV